MLKYHSAISIDLYNSIFSNLMLVLPYTMFSLLFYFVSNVKLASIGVGRGGLGLGRYGGIGREGREGREGVGGGCWGGVGVMGVLFLGL